jgi:hypothetical protein
LELPQQITDGRNQPSDSGNKLAAIVSIAKISLPLQLKRISSGVPILLSVNRASPYKYRTDFQWEMQEHYQQ